MRINPYLYQKASKLGHKHPLHKNNFLPPPHSITVYSLLCIVSFVFFAIPVLMIC